ncbi:hypothetical protein T484DRAFT_1811917, partial [Baffinella frigidus]
QLCQCAASRETTDAIYREVNSTDLVLHIGDISYARGYASEWDFFMDQISPIASRIPWMTAVGNHERDWPSSAVGNHEIDWPSSGSAVGNIDSGWQLLPTIIINTRTSE